MQPMQIIPDKQWVQVYQIAWLVASSYVNYVNKQLSSARTYIMLFSKNSD